MSLMTHMLGMIQDQWTATTIMENGALQGEFP